MDYWISEWPLNFAAFEILQIYLEAFYPMSTVLVALMFFVPNLITQFFKKNRSDCVACSQLVFVIRLLHCAIIISRCGVLNLFILQLIYWQNSYFSHRVIVRLIRL